MLLGALGMILGAFEAALVSSLYADGGLSHPGVLGFIAFRAVELGLAGVIFGGIVGCLEHLFKSRKL